MKKGQLLILAVAAAAVAMIAFLASAGGDGDPGPGAGGNGGAEQTPPPGESVEVVLGYSPEKEPFLVPLVDRFNAEGREVDGKRVVVNAVNVSSGAAERQLAAGELELDVWSPASSMWGRLLNYETDRQMVADENPSIVRTPLVIAMWEPMARALGWPDKQIGFEDILKLSTDERGWAAFGHPEYGAFKLVHTNPDFSTSGLEAVVAEYYAATGKREGLRMEDVSGEARETVRGIERSIVHYGDTTLFIADQMKAEGPGYASAVFMEEVTLLEFNRDRGSQPKLVALYPPEGTFYSDNPYLVLNAPWVDEPTRQAAQAFAEFLAREVTPQVAAEHGFRPADVDTPPLPPVDAENGADPTQPQRVLGLPEPRVLAALRDAWREDRKPANVMLVMDTSGSMAEERRLESAKLGLEEFFKHVAPQDRVGLTTFSDSILELVPIDRFDRNEEQLRGFASGLIADGGTAVWDATGEAVRSVRDLNDRTRINAVVVLTDGEDTDSAQTAEQLVERLRGQGDSANRVRVFTIAYSPGAVGSREGLQAIADATGGLSYEGSTDDIEAVYTSISSFF